MKINFLALLIGFLFFDSVQAQVLFTENFDSYTLGEVSTDFTGNTPGKGGWYVRKGYPNNPAPCEIVAETGKGNVLAIGINKNNNSQGNGSYLTQKNINTLWNSRATGNDVLKFEYDVYLVKSLLNTNGFGSTFIFLNSLDKAVFGNTIKNYYTNSIASGTKAYLEAGANFSTSQLVQLPLGKNNTPEYDNFPYNSWISVQFFIEYKYESGNIVGGTFYVYIPALNILKAAKFTQSDAIASLRIDGSGNGDLPVVVKYDNIKLTALKTLPTYLSTEDFISQKFSIYPNPSTSIVNITNNEDITVSKITVYDVSGKLITTYNYANETEIQLNIAHLQSGTYLLHLESNEGLAIKKVIKK